MFLTPVNMGTCLRYQRSWAVNVGSVYRALARAGRVLCCFFVSGACVALLCCFQLLVPVQSIVWKDPSLK